MSTQNSWLTLQKAQTPARIVICDFCPEVGLCVALLELLKAASELRACGFEVVRLGDLKLDALSRKIREDHTSLAFVVLPPSEPARWVAVFQALHRGATDCPVIVVTDGMEVAQLCDLLRLGATDFLVAPLKAGDVVPRSLRLLYYALRIDPLVQAMKEKFGLQNIIGESPALLGEIGKIPRFAPCDATVLISGETGTGKEVCARAVHYLSPRSGHPFVAANCGAIPAELMENELFGHEKGAFTGADTAQAGLVEEAEGGTLFLDEIDALSLQAQVKLLRLLQEKEYRPLGARRIRRANARLIAASNLHFEEAIQAGIFRRDLYYRLNVLPLNLPPLRERSGDIPLLAAHFLEKYSKEFQRPTRDIAADATQKLLCYHWPGNVRELENAIERAVLLAESPTIQARDFVLPNIEADQPAESFRALKARSVAEFERSYLQTTLRAHHGNITQAAKTAQKNRRAFWELLRKHRLTVEGQSHSP